MRNLLFGFIFISLSATTAPAVVTEQIIAIVNGQPLFQTDLLRHQTLFGMMTPTVKDLIHHKLLLLEAKQFVLSPPQEEEVELAFKAVRKKFSEEASFDHALKETGLTPDGLRREILDRLWVKKLIRDRISFFIFITDAEIGQYYQQHQNDFEQKAFKEVAEKIRAILEKEKEEMKVKEYLAQITSRSNIEINGR